MAVCDTHNRIAEIRLSNRKITLFGVPCAVAVILVCMGIAGMCGYADARSSWWDFPIAVALFIPMIVLHELLHAVAALLFGGVKRADIRLRMVWRAMAAACHVKAPVSVKAARLIAVAPFCITTPLAFAILIGYPSDVTAMLAGMTVVGCFADFVMLFELRRFQANHWFVDHPSEPGFAIYDVDSAECA